MAKWEYTETELWRHGEGEVSLYHVFGIISPDASNVLAFAEARNGNASDSDCTHDIHMCISRDGGRSFLENVCLVPSEGVHCWTNPAPVYDRETCRLFLFYSDNIANVKTENYLIYSDDMGSTWSAPQHINTLLEDGESPSAFHLAGPGHGIQLTGGAFAGRLLMPFWHRKKGTSLPVADRGYSVSVLYSDNHGATWRHSDHNRQECFANESRIVQTRQGLLRNIRTVVSGDTRPYFSFSHDGGVTWSTPVPSPVSPAQRCDMGAISVSGKDGYSDMVLISRVSDPNKRRDMEILISRDGGSTFDDALRLMPGDAMPGYSDLCVIQEEEPVIGLIHCRNNHVIFSRISLQTLTHGRYENTSRSVWP